MSTAISILGGVGLFLLGMTVMTDGLKALAGSALRSVLGKAAATPLSGAFWGAIITLLVQSSSAVTMTTIGLVSAGLLTFPQGLGLVFGANVGTTGTGWLALAYVLFKLIAALIAILAFPATAALMQALTDTADGTTLLAAYHTAYNVVGVAVLLPATQWFTRVVERLLPSRETALQRALDPSALANPVIAVEAARRVVAHVVATMAASVAAGLSGRAGPTTRDGVTAAAAIEEVRDFLSELKEPPETEPERLRLTSTLHALDHAGRLAEILAGGILAGPGAAHDPRAAGLCAQAMRAAQIVGGSITAETALSTQAAPIGWKVAPEVAAALGEAEGAARALDALQRGHRAATLAAVAPGELTAADALARIDTVRQLDALAHHAWRAAAHLVGRGG